MWGQSDQPYLSVRSMAQTVMAVEWARFIIYTCTIIFLFSSRLPNTCINITELLKTIKLTSLIASITRDWLFHRSFSSDSMPDVNKTGGHRREGGRITVLENRLCTCWAYGSNIYIKLLYCIQFSICSKTISICAFVTQYYQVLCETGIQNTRIAATLHKRT